MNNFKAFTLAEIMIVLTVIGVLTAILLPVALTSSPDENVMKFKKGNATLGKVIAELVNNDKYYADGDLGKMPNGNLVTSSTYFCETFGDVVTVKSLACSKQDTGYWTGVTFIPHTNDSKEKYKEVQEFIDDQCVKTQSVGAEITTSDNIIFYQANPAQHFGSFAKLEGETETNERLFELKNIGDGREESAFNRVLKIVCMDVDDIPNNATEKNCVNECPFGYGIRVDGKIMYGARADEWINKSLQKGDS